MAEFLSGSLFFGVAVTIIAYQLGLAVRKKFRCALFHPLVVAILLIIPLLTICGVEYESYRKGADYLSYLLTPATVCLAIPLYQQIHLLRENGKAICAGIAAGVLSSLGSVFLLALAFGLSHREYVTLLPKSITTAIGMGVAEEFGGEVTIAVAVIILTGIFGNMAAEVICKTFRIEEPIAKGVAIGTASHAIGTARAMEMGEVEGAMSSLAIVVSGMLTVLAASFFAGLL